MMRVIRFFGFLLILASAVVVSAIVASEIAASANQRDARTAKAMEDETSRLCSATTDSTVDLDIRVVEINTTRLKALGFDCPSAPREQLVIGSVGSGLLGFIDALDHEGLVQQDVTLAEHLAEGQTWETVLRWRVAAEKGQKSAWRNLRLRVCPTTLGADAVRLETACGAHFSEYATADAHATDKSMVDLGAKLADQATLCLNANFVAADPEQSRNNEVRVFVLITPRRSGCESQADLLAPRNVLDHHTARAEQSSHR